MRRNIYDRLWQQRLRDEQRLEEERLLKEAQEAPPPPPERYHTNELSFVRPQGFKDKTFHVFTLTDIGPSPLSVVIGRSAIEANADLETVAQKLLDELSKSLSHLDWIEPLHPVKIAGIDARQVEFKWRQQGNPIHQLQLIFLHKDEQLNPVLMQITVSSSSALGMNHEERNAFFSVIETLELRFGNALSPDGTASL